MHRIDANTSRDFSRFDMLSTDELRQIIRQDSLLNENESANVEAILYISKLLSDREQADRPRDVAAAWESFQKDYLPYSGDPEPLYALDEEVSERQAEKKKRTRILIPAAVLVAAILLLFAVWMYNPKQGTAPDQTEVSLFPELSAALSACDVKEAVIPKWLPKKYEGEDLKIIETPDGAGLFYDGSALRALVVASPAPAGLATTFLEWVKHKNGDGFCEDRMSLQKNDR